ncbi:MAG: metal ABC transporter substrate-binding protein [Lachnospiraceae bacterium]|nr:metal ABC transporter substrate-binding protein [Lachnospiraceae bacterium]
MKKYLAYLIAVIMLTGSLCACGSGNKETASSSDGTQGDDGIHIVTTIFPVYDWVKNVLGENPAGAEVTMLLDNGVDLHSYQPSVDDIMKISTCDLFIYVGGESDGWVDGALAEAENKDMVVINLLDALGDSAKEEEIVEGMQETEHDHDHEHEEGEEHDEDSHDEDTHDEEDHDEDGAEHEHEHEREVEYDEHVWLSLRNAAAYVQDISGSVQGIDPDNAETYSSNAAAYIEKIDSLDEEYKTAVQNASFHTLLFGDRFPFRYLVDDYGLDYYAAFVGCSAETEASFETITFLAQKVDELGLPAVMTIEGEDHRIAETVIANTQSKGIPILSMDSMQGTTSDDVQNGTTYLSVMENNLSVLMEALK